MTNSDSYQKWIKSAYVLFAQEGPDNISVKALAKECGLPRTNFYYYFANKQELIEKLIEFHFNSTTEVFNKELEKRLHTLIPDLYEILCDLKIGVQFTKQLFNNRENPLYDKAYRQTISLSSDILVTAFLSHTKIDLPIPLAKTLWFTLTDSWYSQICFNDFNVESNIALYQELTAPYIYLSKK